MTKKDIERVTRSFVGHLATHPNLRDRLNSLVASKDNEGIADLINETVVPKDNVTSQDVPQIRTLAAKMLPAKQTPGTGSHVVNVVGGGGHGP